MAVYIGEISGDEETLKFWCALLELPNELESTGIVKDKRGVRRCRDWPPGNSGWFRTRDRVVPEPFASPPMRTWLEDSAPDLHAHVAGRWLSYRGHPLMPLFLSAGGVASAARVLDDAIAFVDHLPPHLWWRSGEWSSARADT